MFLVKQLALLSILLSIPRRLNGFSYQPTNQLAKRIPHKKKTSVRWTIQSLEKLLAVDGERGAPFTYKRKADASLIDALYLLLRSKSANDTLDCERRLEVLMRTSSFPLQVTERVLKIAAVAGLEPLATDLLQRACATCELVSPQAYTALLNCLRRKGELEKMEEVLLNLAGVCRRTTDDTAAVDIVAFNTYVSAICEAAVSSQTDTSEQLLLKALGLLKSDTTKSRFCLKQELDHYSFNPLLGAVAKLASPSNGQSTKTLLLATMKRMRSLGLHADDYAQNSRLRAAIACDGDDAGVTMFWDIFSQRPLDGYSIGLMIGPLLRTGRKEELITVMSNFYSDNASTDGKTVSSAFESYFSSLVGLGEIGLAKSLFERFFLCEHSSTSCERVEVLVLNHDEGGSLRPTRKMFNILLSGYSTLRKNAADKRGPSHGEEDQFPPEMDEAFDLFNSMIEAGVQVDSYTTSAMMTLCRKSDEPQKVTNLLRAFENNMSYDFSPAAYRSIISAYARTNEPSSSIIIWEEMCKSRPNVLKNRDTWNTLLGALQQGACSKINMTDSSAAARNAALNNAAVDGILSSLLNGLEPYDAADSILGIMRNRTAVLQDCRAPRPNSQSYCIVASILAKSNVPSKSHVALELFRNAMDENCPGDGRFINAVLRCFGDDLDGALGAWKCQLGAAAASHERSGSAANRLAAYNGLMYTAGRAVRPDIGLRIAYAMAKAGVDPTEVTLNSYLAGKRMTLDGATEEKNLGLRRQYESLLTVECTKYSSFDKRRQNDKKIRIIL